MRIHSDTLTHADLNNIVYTVPGVQIPNIVAHGSRKRSHAFEVNLTGHGRTGGQWGNASGLPTASWDEWGVVIGKIYDADPQAIVGPYTSPEQFHALTANRFDGREIVLHHAHRWDFEGIRVNGEPYVRVFHCKGTKGHPCAAMQYLPNWPGLNVAATLRGVNA